MTDSEPFDHDVSDDAIFDHQHESWTDFLNGAFRVYEREEFVDRLAHFLAQRDVALYRKTADPFEGRAEWVKPRAE